MALQAEDNESGTFSRPGIKIDVKAKPDDDEVDVKMAIVPTFPCRLTVEIAYRQAIDLQEIPPHKSFRLRDRLQEDDAIDLFISPASTEGEYICGDSQNTATVYFKVLLKTLALIRCSGLDAMGITLEITVNNLRIFCRQ